MSQSLLFEEGNKSSDTETTTSPPFTRVIRDVVSLCKFRRIVVAFLLALFRSPVEEELHFDLEVIWNARNRNSQKKIHPSASRCLLLKFSHEIASVVFTGECIVSKGTKLELVDAVTGYPVRNGPLASAEVEIFLLNGDFTGGDGRGNWTTKELKAMLGKNPYLRMQQGAVSVGDEVRLKHTPKWMKKSEVRLGARIVDQPAAQGIKVREAVTGPFVVKDKRLKSKKRYPPSPTDDVWRLEKIGKNGAFHNQLSGNGIRTVEDFQVELSNNPQRLRHILGKSMSDGYWKTVTLHAKTCNLEERKYLYYHLETEQKFAVVFNVAGQVTWLDSSCGLTHFNVLSESQKVCADKLVETALANWENVLKFDSEISIIYHLSSCPKLGSQSGHLSGNLVMVDECQHSKIQNTSRPHLIQKTAEHNQLVVSADCSTSHATADQHGVINSPDRSVTGLSDVDIPSVILDSGDDWEKIWQFLNSDEIHLDDSPNGEPGPANCAAAETSASQFHGLQHGERMDLSQNQFTRCNMDRVSENARANIHGEGMNVCLMDSTSMGPVASVCKGKSKKSWAKISSILRWFFLKRLVKLKRVRITKKRKYIDQEI